MVEGKLQSSLEQARARDASPDAAPQRSGPRARFTLLARTIWRKARAEPALVFELPLNLAAFVTFTYVKVDAIAGKPPIYTGDGRVWATIAEAPFFDRTLLLPRRPIVYPLLFKAGLSDPQIVSIQLSLGILSWGLLAYALSRFVTAL